MVAKHALVVGVGPGMGRALALNYARHGYDVTLVARRQESLEPVAGAIRDLGRRAWPVQADGADPGAIAEVVANAAEHGQLCLLHHNASMHIGSLLEADPQAVGQALDVNVVAAVAAVQAALPDLAATRGIVAWTGGGIALNPRPEYGVLAIGKAALRAAGLALAPELATSGVRLRMLTINGFIRPGGRFDPDRIAEAFWDYLNDPQGLPEKVFDGR